MSIPLSVEHRRSHEGGATGVKSVWWLICKQELKDLWIGGRVLMLLILYTVLMSITGVMRQVESQMSLIPPAEMVFLTLLGSITFGLFIGLILGADSISGERERATLEPLLLSPISRRQIVLGKFLAALSPWPVAYLLSIPYLSVLAQGNEVFGEALLLGGILGTVLAVSFTGFGMLMSIWSRSNKISLFVSLLSYIILLIPTQFPGSAQKGDLGYFVQQLNPMQATSGFLEKYLVNNRTLEEMIGYLVAAGLSVVVILGLLFLFAAPRLSLYGGFKRATSKAKLSRAAGVLLIGGLLSLAPALPVNAQMQSEGQNLQMTVDLEYVTVEAGDEITFKTVVTNNGSETTPPMNVAMNIVNAGKGGDPVDPEDWSPQRTQSIDPLQAGGSVEHAWIVDAILKGDYMVYLTVIPTPAGPEATSQPVASPGIHLTVSEFSNSNPGGILPVAIGMPLALVLISLLPRRSKRWRTHDSEKNENT